MEEGTPFCCLVCYRIYDQDPRTHLQTPRYGKYKTHAQAFQSHELLSLFQASGVLAKNKPSGKKKR